MPRFTYDGRFLGHTGTICVESNEQKGEDDGLEST